MKKYISLITSTLCIALLMIGTGNAADGKIIAVTASLLLGGAMGISLRGEEATAQKYF